MSRRPGEAMIISANELLDGAVVYYAAGGRWSRSLGDALVAATEAEAEALEAALAAAVERGEVVEPEIVRVGADPAGRIVPSHYRERIRALGPTVRLDLGPQARGEHKHVSL